jgi:hypothetical protein
MGLLLVVEIDTCCDAGTTSDLRGYMKLQENYGMGLGGRTKVDIARS